MDDLVPNHHAAYRHSGVSGWLAGFTMTVGRGGDARLVADRAGVDDAVRVLDLGCGPGTAARLAARRGARVTGADPSAPMLAWARFLTRFRPPKGQVEWVSAGAENLPLADDTVSVCWSLASVHHWPELDEGIAEVHRVLSPGGCFLALERRSPPGATGHASHGWTPGQAQRFAEMLSEARFVDVDVSNHDVGRHRQIVLVTGRTPTA